MGINKETMNIHDALVELKTIGKRINNEISDLKVLSTAPSNKKDSEEARRFADAARGQLVSIADLRRRRMAIKAAVVKSNATTMVLVNGREMSIAEIIEMRKEYIHELESLQRYLTKAFTAATSRVESDRQSAIRSALNTLQAKSAEALTAEQVAAFNQLVEMQSTILVQPTGIDIENLLKEISDTLDGYARLDSLLSTKNATTTIEVEYSVGELFSEKLVIEHTVPANDAEKPEDPVDATPQDAGEPV